MLKKILIFCLIVALGTQTSMYAYQDTTRLNFEFLIALENGDIANVNRCFKKDVDVNQIFQGPVVPKSLTPLMLEISRLQKQETIKSNWVMDGVYAGGSIVVLILLLYYVTSPVFSELKNLDYVATVKKLLDNPALFVTGNDGQDGKDNFMRAFKLLVSLSSLAVIPTVTVPYAKKFKKGVLNGWNKLDRQKIIVELIKHPKLDIKKEVNGITALTLVQNMLKVEKDEAFKVVLKLFEELMIKRIQEEDLKRKKQEAQTQNSQDSVTVTW